MSEEMVLGKNYSEIAATVYDTMKSEARASRSDCIELLASSFLIISQESFDACAAIADNLGGKTIASEIRLLGQEVSKL